MWRIWPHLTCAGQAGRVLTIFRGSEWRHGRDNTSVKQTEKIRERDWTDFVEQSVSWRGTPGRNTDRGWDATLIGQSVPSLAITTRGDLATNAEIKAVPKLKNAEA